MCQMGKGGCIDDKGLEMDVLLPGMILQNDVVFPVVPSKESPEYVIRRTCDGSIVSLVCSRAGIYRYRDSIDISTAAAGIAK
jgi:hypothetical protein